MILELIAVSPLILGSGVLIKRKATPLLANLSLPSLSGPTEELFAGAPKPSGILAGMICTKLLTDEFKPRNNKAAFKGFTLEWELLFTKKSYGNRRYIDHPRLQEAAERVYRSEYIRDGGYATARYSHANEEINNWLDGRVRTEPYLLVTGLDVEFSESEKTKILKTLEKALELYKQRLEAEKAAENQMKAVAAIEEFFKPVTPVIEEKQPEVKAVKPSKESLLSPVSISKEL